MRAQHPEMALLVRGIEQECERHLEHVGDLDGIRLERERRLDPADDRRHAVAGHRLVVGKMAQHRDALGGQADFLGRFAQRGGGERRVARLDAPARES